MGEKSRRRREAFEGREVRPRVVGNGVKSKRRTFVSASFAMRVDQGLYPDDTWGTSTVIRSST